LIVKTGLQTEEIIQNPAVRNEVAVLNEREARFYQEFAADCGLGTPKHYFSAHDTATATAIFLMEDVGHLRSVSQWDNCSLDDGRAGLLSLANMHSTWWESEQLGKHRWLRDHASNIRPELLTQRFAESIDPFLEISGDHVPVGIENIARKFLPKLVDVATEQATGPVTLVHGDYRMDNLYFDDSLDIESRVVAIDWQTVGRVRGTEDVSMFVFMNFDVDFRREHEKQLLTEYHSSLRNGGVGDYSYDAFLDDLRLSLLLQMARIISAVTRAITRQTSEDVRARIYEVC
jgi:hypothetical protein